jgi:hypothetical protein
MLARKRALLVRATILLAEKRAKDAMAAIVRVVIKTARRLLGGSTNRTWSVVILL